MRSALRSCALSALFCATATATQSPPLPQPTVITQVRLGEAADAPLVAILLKDGHITQILAAGEELPAGWHLVDGGGAFAVPAFVDAYTTAGIETPEPEAVRDDMSPLAGNVHVGMREANRKGLQPALSGASVFAMDKEGRGARRKYGFGVMHSSPSGQILGGQSLVCTLGTGALRDRILQADLFQAAALRASGRGYPSTLMGYLSHLRQFVEDARWQALRQERAAAGKGDRRPPHDADLDAIGAVLAGEQRLMCHANDAGDILRWINFSQKQGVKILISGGREAWKVTDELLAAEVPVLLGLDWGKEVKDPDKKKDSDDKKDSDEKTDDGDEPANEELSAEEPVAEEAPSEGLVDETTGEQTSPEETETEEGAKVEEADKQPNWTYEEPLGVRRERRRLWEERRDCAIRLHEAGVPFALGTEAHSAKDLLKNLRELVELGLPKDVALASLTTTAATLLGQSATLGKLEPGFAANIALWGGSPFAKKAKLHWLFIDGATFEFEVEEETAGDGPDEGIDLTGEWKLTYGDTDNKPASLSLTMEEDGALDGTLTLQMGGGDKTKSALSGAINGKTITLKGTLEMGNFTAEIRVDAEYEDGSFSGEVTWKYSSGEDSRSFEAARVPGRRAQTHDEKLQSTGHNHGPYDRTDKGGQDR